MTTTRIRTVKATLGDYSSLAGWEAGEQGDLPTLDEIRKAECYNFADANDVAFSGWETDSTRYIWVFVPLAERHDGTSRDVGGTGYQISSGSSVGTIRPVEDYVVLEGLNIKNTTIDAAINWTSGTFTASTNSHTLLNCIIQNANTASTKYTLNASISNLIITLENCIVYGGTRSIDCRNATTVTINNCTFWRHTDQIGIIADTELTCKNTYAGKSSGTNEDFWTGGAAPSGNNNASSDTSAATDYTATQTSESGSANFINVTAGSENFGLKSDATIIGDGAAGITTYDILGTTRDVSAPDIGAFEYVAAGGGRTTKNTDAFPLGDRYGMSFGFRTH